MKKGPAELLDKTRVAERFRASGATYEERAIVQREISRQLVAILDRCGVSGWTRVLEIGCCTGVLTEFLCRKAPIDRLFLNDLVQEFCRHTEKRVATCAGSVETLPGDIEQTELPAPLDLIISSSTFQWLADLPGMLKKMATALRPGGNLAFSIFGPGTMGEIGALTGSGLPYHTPETLAAMVEKNFRLLTIHTERKRLYFPSVRAVLRHVRETGVGGVQGERMTMKKLKEFERQYVLQFQGEEGLPVTYVTTFVVAERPGSGRLS